MDAFDDPNFSKTVVLPREDDKKEIEIEKGTEAEKKKEK